MPWRWHPGRWSILPGVWNDNPEDRRPPSRLGLVIAVLVLVILGGFVLFGLLGP